MISDLSDWIAGTWAEGIRDPAAQNVWQFAAENIVFDAKMGNITGPWRPDMTPFTLLFQEAVTSNFSSIPEGDWWLRDLVNRGQRVDECFVVKSSQTGFTQAMLNACVYLPLFDPGRLLYALDSREKAKRLVKFRLIPFLRRLCGRVIEDDQDVNLSMIELANMIMEFGGSYSAGLFAEKPLRYGFLDDVEYMVAEGGNPGMLDGIHVIDHLRSRFTTSDESFLGVVSKPNLESSDFIANHRAGSQHRFFVPCPHCGERQILQLENLNWQHKGCKDLAGRFDLEAIEALTTYRCAHCKADIQEASKYEMNKAGQWLPKSKEERARDDDPPAVPRRLSLTINDLYSPFPKVKWGMLATKLVTAENNPGAMRYVLTNHFARPHKIQAVHLKSEQILALCAGALDPKTGQPFDARCAPYQRGEIPFRPAFLSMTIDRQGDRLKWIVFAWKSDGTAALVEYGMFRDRSEQIAMKEDYDRRLLDYLDDPVAHHGGHFICLADPAGQYRIDWALFDSGYEHTAVYATCLASGDRMFPSKGGGTLESGKICEGRPEFYDGVNFYRYHYNDFALKVLFYKYKIGQRTEPRLYLPENIDGEFIVEWLSESLGPSRHSGGIKKMEWQHDSKIGPNDWGDCGKMQYVIWQIVGASRLPTPPPRETQPPAESAAPANLPDLAAVLAVLGN